MKDLRGYTSQVWKVSNIMFFKFLSVIIRKYNYSVSVKCHFFAWFHCDLILEKILCVPTFEYFICIYCLIVNANKSRVTLNIHVQILFITWKLVFILKLQFIQPSHRLVLWRLTESKLDTYSFWACQEIQSPWFWVIVIIGLLLRNLLHFDLARWLLCNIFTLHKHSFIFYFIYL